MGFTRNDGCLFTAVATPHPSRPAHGRGASQSSAAFPEAEASRKRVGSPTLFAEGQGRRWPGIE